MRRAQGSGVVAVFALVLIFAGSGGDAATASRALVSPNCGVIVAYTCATVSVGWKPTPGRDAGSGTAVSTPAGINCTYTFGIETGTCSHRFSWPVGQTSPDVYVTFESAYGSVWCLSSPNCNPTTALWASGYLSAGAPAEYDISFFLLLQDVSVTRTGPGTGTVTVPAVDGEQGGTGATGMSCSGSTSPLCHGQFDYGRPLRLIATPDAGAAFTAWTGACAGQGATCTITPAGLLQDTTSTNAVFGLASPATTTPTTTTLTTTHATTTNPAVVRQLQAQLIGIKSGKSKLGFRVEYVEVQAGETINATLLLSRNGRHLAHTSIPGIRPGDRVLTLPIPGSVGKGETTLTVALTDSAGNHHTWTRTVRLAG